MKSRFAIFSVFIALVAACAPETKVPDIVWPLPPDPPRIKYVGIYQTDKDVENTSSAGEAIFGKEVSFALSRPYGVAVDNEGRVYVTDEGRVAVFDKKNKKVSFIGESGMGKLSKPAGVAVSHLDGTVFVSDISEQKVFVYDANFKLLTTIGKKEDLQNPMSLALDDARHRLYVVDNKQNLIKAYSTKGEFLFNIGKPGNEDGDFHWPTFMATDSTGNMYVSDTFNFRVQILDPEGKFLKSFGRLGDTYGTFTRPKGIALDSEGHIYVVDSAFQNVQIFDKDGQLLLSFGQYGAGPGEFILPVGIAIDRDDRIYVTEQMNKRVQIFQYMSEKWKKENPDPKEQKK